MKYKIFKIASALLFSLALSGCTHRAKVLTKDEYMSFVGEIMESAYQEVPNLEVFNNAFDKKAFADKILKFGDIPKSYKKNLLAYIDDYFKPGDDMIEKVKDGADYQLLKFYIKNDTAHVMFRIYTGNIAIEDWALAVHKKQIFVNDIFTAISGLSLSYEWNMNACSYFSIYSDCFLINKKLIDINAFVADEQFSKADSVFNLIDQATTNNIYAKTLKMNLIHKNQTLDSLKKYCKHFLKIFPEHKETAIFYCLQSAVNQGNIGEVEKYCDTLEKITGSDPLFFLYYAWTYKAANDYPSSLKMLDSLTSHIPTIYFFYNYKLDLYYAMKDVEGFVNQLNEIDKLFESSENDVPFYENTYPDMKTQSAFIEWKKQHLEKYSNQNDTYTMH